MHEAVCRPQEKCVRKKEIMSENPASAANEAGEVPARMHLGRRLAAGTRQGHARRCVARPMERGSTDAGGERRADAHFGGYHAGLEVRHVLRQFSRHDGRRSDRETKEPEAYSRNAGRDRCQNQRPLGAIGFGQTTQRPNRQGVSREIRISDGDREETRRSENAFCRRICGCESKRAQRHPHLWNVLWTG